MNLIQALRYFFQKELIFYKNKWNAFDFDMYRKLLRRSSSFLFSFGVSSLLIRDDRNLGNIICFIFYWSNFSYIFLIKDVVSLLLFRMISLKVFYLTVLLLISKSIIWYFWMINDIFFCRHLFALSYDVLIFFVTTKIIIFSVIVSKSVRSVICFDPFDTSGLNFCVISFTSISFIDSSSITTLDAYFF